MAPLASRLRDLAGGDDQLGRLAERFYRLTVPEDVANDSDDELLARVGTARALGEHRAPGTAKVEIVRDPDGLGTVATLVTDDMPFLVDSVTAALQREGRTIRLLTHPLLVVRRDDHGRLLEVLDLDVDDPRPADAVAESWMSIHLDRDYVNESEDRTRAHLLEVLEDVRAAVADWSAMRERARQTAQGLRDDPPRGVDGAEVEDAADLLDWLAADHFTFIGYREYRLATVDGQLGLERVPGTGLGLLRGGDDGETSTRFAALPPSVRELALDPHILVLTKANSRSTVHRPAYLDYIGVKVFDPSGTVVGERRFLGLLTASAYNESVAQVPVLARRVEQVTDALGLIPGSHDAKDLRHFLETYPRDELFQTQTDALIEIASSVMHMQERRQTRLYVRIDDYQRYVSCLVYLPRDRYTTTVRQRIERLLTEAWGGVSVDYTALVTESVLARLHYVVRLAPGATIPAIDLEALEERISLATQSWEDRFTTAVAEAVGEARTAALLTEYGTAFPEAYKEAFDPSVGVTDALVIERLQPGELALEAYGLAPGGRRLHFKLIQVGQTLSLSRILPSLQNLGVEVIDQHPYEIHGRGSAPAWILDFGLDLPDATDDATLTERFTEAFRASWFGECESDAFNALVVRAGLTWQQAAVIRAYARYLRQIGSAFGPEYIQRVVAVHTAIVRWLVELFEVQFDPECEVDRDARADDIIQRIESGLAGVESLDHDRILRSILGLIRATLRTNVFARNGSPRQAYAFKLDPRAIPDMPLPIPRFEIWVSSPRVEGVHLRFGMVARGGLRWSDRSEDFRTEILGLVKAQEVKNAVIVPVGAKGGFVPRDLPDPTSDREGWLTEGKESYREFVSSLLDITDNLVGDVVVPPEHVVRRDGDDPYLVVAADKGTATLSDLANAIAAEYGFWLGDAFASGGSVGYDHKAMGITARGAWESVKRHFREIGMDIQREPFTVVGIGDMSGDVFGNGMLLSEQIRLVAAFDHRDIFIDPDPDAAATFAERQRLFALPRSSWTDFDPAVISPGGGVYSRSAKAIELSPQAKAALGIDAETGPMTPDDVIRHILTADVDLLWNGGIGTYVKARTQTNADAGDKANDAIRVNGDQLRCRVVGEGGNLGLTQLGRVEASREGVRLNTDAIDNSAGVDTSDHEVNIKILLDGFVRAGDMTEPQRAELLAEMTDAVADLVLADNYAQNVVLGNARAAAPALISVHQRMIGEMERSGLLNRALEALPDDAEIVTRIQAGTGLTSPELCVLLAYAKIQATGQLMGASLSDDPWFQIMLRRYFPPAIVNRFGGQLDNHPLRDQIIDTVTVNRLVNIGGITFIFRGVEETGASIRDIIKAGTATMEIFDVYGVWSAINAQDNLIPTAAQDALHLEHRRLLDRGTRWFLQTRGTEIHVGDLIKRFGPVVRDYAHLVPGALRGAEADRLQRTINRFLEMGVPADLADIVSTGLDVFTLLDIKEVASRTGEDLDTLIPLYFAISEHYDVDETLMRITALSRGDHWSSLARQALRSDLYGVIAGLTSRISRATDPALGPDARIAAWEHTHAAGLARARATLMELSSQDAPDLAMLSVALRVMRNLVAQGTASTLD